jgi:FAD/FMN-containing dehydrogenase
MKGPPGTFRLVKVFLFIRLLSAPSKMGATSYRTLLAIILGIQLSSAAPTQETTQACTEITNALPGKVVTAGLLALEYAYETQQYWNNALRTITPACIVQPESAQDVSAVVKILIRYPTVYFATRSGGHDTNPGHASVADGVLISMTNLAGATYDPTTGLAYVKPGGEWNDVIGELEPSGHVIAGGRLGGCNPASQIVSLTYIF